LEFTVPALPPMPDLLPIAVAAEAARNDGDQAELEELALRVAGAVAIVLAGAKKRARAPSRRDERRIAAAVRQIEMHAHEPLSVVELARSAAMAPYHFFRTFRAVVGKIPREFILHTLSRSPGVR